MDPHIEEESRNSDDRGFEKLSEIRSSYTIEEWPLLWEKSIPTISKLSTMNNVSSRIIAWLGRSGTETRRSRYHVPFVFSDIIHTTAWKAFSTSYSTALPDSMLVQLGTPYINIYSILLFASQEKDSFSNFVNQSLLGFWRLEATHWG
jgi:hypothetical protein